MASAQPASAVQQIAIPPEEPISSPVLEPTTTPQLGQPQQNNSQPQPQPQHRPLPHPLDHDPTHPLQELELQRRRPSLQQRQQRQQQQLHYHPYQQQHELQQQEEEGPSPELKRQSAVEGQHLDDNKGTIAQHRNSVIAGVTPQTRPVSYRRGASESPQPQDPNADSEITIAHQSGNAAPVVPSHRPVPFPYAVTHASGPDISPPRTQPPAIATGRPKGQQSKRVSVSFGSDVTDITTGRTSSLSSKDIVIDFSSNNNNNGGSGGGGGGIGNGSGSAPIANARPDGCEVQGRGEEKRVSRPPPVSFKGLPVANPVEQHLSRVPQLRTSGSRRSLNLDTMTTTLRDVRPAHFHSSSRDLADSSYDHTLRALEGREDTDAFASAPDPAAHDVADGDDTTGDLFLRIARQDTIRSSQNDIASHEPDFTHMSKPLQAIRAHRRPLSTASPPPRKSRRLSGQQVPPRSDRNSDDPPTQLYRSATQRLPGREISGFGHQAEEFGRPRVSSSAMRSTPVTPRSIVFQDLPEGVAHTRRRASVTESNNIRPQSISSSTHKGAGLGIAGQPRIYGSSPLAPRGEPHGQQQQHAQPQQPPQQQHNRPDGSQGVEGTESTSSTNAPSTVWDELDDLKSRIHRLELTGKLPTTSGAAVARISDERPPTATTATTSSSSPKLGSAFEEATGDIAKAENSSVASTSISQLPQSQQHPVLHSALAKSRPLLSPGIYSALEAASADALALLSMMGMPGHHGPISSGASSIGTGTSITDRQLRRKADGICRSLTELCIALGEGVPPPKPVAVPQQEPQLIEPQQQQQQQEQQQPQQLQPQPPQQQQHRLYEHHQPHQHIQSQKAVIIQQAMSDPVTPTVGKSPSIIGLPSKMHKRPSMSDERLTKLTTSPRALSKLEERRNNLLNGTALPSPRFMADGTPMSPPESTVPAPGRRSSLLLARTRRAVTDEVDDGRVSSLRTRRTGAEEAEEDVRALVLRNRQAVTEEPDEGRKTSLLMRGRRDTSGPGIGNRVVEYEVGEDRFRAPSRAITEVAGASGIRRTSRNYVSQLPAPDQVLPSAGSLGNSALPRRRLASSTLNTRIVAPSVSTVTSSGQRYLARSSAFDREAALVDRGVVIEGRPERQRPMSMITSQPSLPNRAPSLSRRRQYLDGGGVTIVASQDARSTMYR